MSTRILYDASSAEGQQVAEFVDEVLSVLAKGRRLKGQLDSMMSGNPSTPAQVETEVGGMTQGTGQALWAIISTAVAQIDSPQIAELSRLDVG